MHRLVVSLSFGLFLVAAACGGRELKAAGEECVATSECDDGLVCDFGQTPAVCAEFTTEPPDAGPPPPDGPPGIDAPPNPIDAAAPDAMPIDAAPPDAAPPDAMPIDAPPPDAMM